MKHLSTFYRHFLVFFSFCFLLFSATLASADTLQDTLSARTLCSYSSYVIYTNTTAKSLLIDTKTLSHIDYLTLYFDIIQNGTTTVRFFNQTSSSTPIFTKYFNHNNTAGEKTLTINEDTTGSDYFILEFKSNVSGNHSISMRPSNYCTSLGFTLSDINKYYPPVKSEQKFVFNNFDFLYPFISGINFIPSKLIGTLGDDGCPDCPTCEICDYDDEIPYGVPFLNDVTMVTGYTESYDASTSEMLTIEKKYYHIPVIAVFFLSTVIIIVMSRLLAEFLKRISQR